MKIENIDQLNAEIRKLEAKSLELKAQLKQDYEDIKEELKPKNFLLDLVSDISGFKITRDSVFEKGFALALRFLLNRFLITTEIGVEKQAGILLKKVTTRITELLKKIFKKKNKEAVPEDDGNFDGE